MKTSYQDQLYIMNIALLEVSASNNIEASSIRLHQSKKDSNTWYVISKKFIGNKPEKIYFKKTFVPIKNINNEANNKSKKSN